MCIRDSYNRTVLNKWLAESDSREVWQMLEDDWFNICDHAPVSYTHLRAHETVLDLVCRLLLEKKKKLLL